MPFLNPWFLLAGLLAILGAFGVGYASNDQADKVQAAWDNANRVAIDARAQRIARARTAEHALQVAADDDRRKDDAERKRLADRLDAALGELRNRPYRPAPAGPASVPGNAAGAGPEAGGCTGSALYRDDAEFLARVSALASGVRAQRDACYVKYYRAKASLEALAAEKKK